MEKHSKQIKTLQVVRFAAAVLVVVQHFGPQNGFPALAGVGDSGLALFFVLSGFIIPLSIRGPNAVDFLKRRAERILPMYWICSTVKLLAGYLSITKPLGTLSYIVSSFLFIPRHNPDGLLLPFLPVGWSLEVEWMFYLVIATALVLARRRLLGSGFLIALLLVYGIFPARYIHDMPKFVFGMLLALRYQKRQITLSWLPCAAALLAASIAMLLLYRSSEAMILIPLLAFIVIGCCLELEPLIGERIPSILILLGDSSYSLYLTHWLLILPLDTVQRHLSLPRYVFLATVLMLTVTMSVGCYLLLERPIMRKLKHRLRVEPEIEVAS